jgi:3-hydroxyisobutyrate dehydrogenase
MNRVGFVGLGTMGAPMARNLLRAGHELTFFARRPEVRAEFEAAGARFAASPAAVAAAVDFIITIVPTDREIHEVVLGPDGIVSAAVPGKLHIEMSTISPALVRELGQALGDRGMSMLDAPVSGGPSGARNATLTIMVGGSQQDLDRARPVLDAMGERIIHCGPLGAGQTIKVINQMMSGGIMALVGEGVALARAAGIDLERFADVVATSSGGSTIFSARRKMIVADDYQPAFRTELMRKDVGLALDMAKQLNVPLPLAAAAFQQYTAALQAGLGKLDFASIARLCCGAAGQQ